MSKSSWATYGKLEATGTGLGLFLAGLYLFSKFVTVDQSLLLLMISLVPMLVGGGILYAVAKY